MVSLPGSCERLLSPLRITALPRENLKGILQFVKQVQSFLQECVGPDEALGADDLVPATILPSRWLCKCSSQRTAFLIVRLIYELVPMTGEEEYCLANFEGGFDIVGV